ncbi:MAG: Hsp20/alpha crystallin family protein [Euryarchaeota archaeon]|nr:Hsp20/alpha crystallin family protein [Euryarchaeota archaeon]
MRRREAAWDDLFGDFEREFEEMRRGIEDLMGRLISEDGLVGREPLVFGFSARTGPEGARPMRYPEDASNMEVMAERKEPLTDIIEEEGRVRVLVEMPGVRKEEISLNGTEDALDIGVKNPDKQLSKRLELPCAVIPGSAKATYRNGVLEVILKKERKSSGMAIRID